MTRLIVHVDMDAFYASVEVREQPELEGQPVAVIVPGRRGIVMTANYVARNFGVHSALPVYQARLRCPGIVLLPQRMDLYRAVSAQIHGIFARYTEAIEPLALDEAYLDVTGEDQTLEGAQHLAADIQADILRETRLTCSAGVSVNKFLAKFASGLQKPAGLTVIRPEEVDALLAALTVDEFYGVGPVIAGKLRAQGIETGADLRARSLVELQAVLGSGKLAPRLHGLARGVDDRPVEAHREPQSIGVERTFEQDLTTREALLAELPGLTQELAARLSRRGYVGRTAVLKMSFEDGTTVTRHRTREQPLAGADELAQAVTGMLTSELSAERRVRLLGVSVVNLSPRA
ncbi:DNA polymerase IV [Deinococcus humi]|uniref:DNA polymerase IV n=1 Tax=Deinococcus humi TaxID=662880 RepID=A0A7W8JUQ9_9DEIO|nr:DNA polymerase IV [Deinococcus humi]MBB5363637.1 DNA polymerase-4 [Deinococcus humi]GGO29956.1 DNA polymerase IV [Deinococcus humi]